MNHRQFAIEEQPSERFQLFSEHFRRSPEKIDFILELSLIHSKFGKKGNGMVFFYP